MISLGGCDKTGESTRTHTYYTGQSCIMNIDLNVTGAIYFPALVVFDDTLSSTRCSDASC